MDNNEKELEMGGVSANLSNESTVNNNELINQNPVNFNTASNVFMYTDNNSNSVEETVSTNPFNYVDDSTNNTTESSSVENAFVYTDTPVEATTSEMNKVENQFTYTDLKDIPQNNVEEKPKYNPPTQTNNTNNYNSSTTKEEKGNFGFMIVFALIMVGIIVALPYIAGYK